MDIYIPNAHYQVDKSLLAAQKLGLTNNVPVAQPYQHLQGTNHNNYQRYSSTGGYQIGTDNKLQRGREYSQSYQRYHQPQPLQLSDSGRGGRRMKGRGRGRGGLSNSTHHKLKSDPSFFCSPRKSDIKPDLNFNFSLFDKFDNGMIFLCNRSTEEECLKNMIFAAEAGRMGDMSKISRKTALFLYRLTPKQCILHGVFQAVGSPGLDIIPGAFGGRFPAQIRVEAFFRFPYPVQNQQIERVLMDKNRCRMLTKRETRLLFKEFTMLYMRDTVITYLSRQMGLSEFVPICNMVFEFSKREMEDISKSCFEE